MPNNTKKKKADKKNKKSFWKIFFRVILICIFIGIALGVGFIVSVLNGAGALSRADFEISNLSTIIYDKYGNEYVSLYSSENRLYSGLGEMSPYLPKAFIAIEDERFEKHIGIDIKRTAAAVVQFVFTGDSEFGGSTITQQLIKKVTEDNGRNWQRKAREIVRAIQVEQWLTKDQIIELYMNMIYLGSGAYGVETAAYTYFNKSAADLDIAEAALIAGLAQAPEGYNPYVHPDKAKARQELVLGKMKQLGYISAEEYEAAKSKELVYEKGTMQQTSSNSYFIDALIDTLIADLQEEKGVTAAMARKMIYSNGLQIYTTIDPEIQEAIETVYVDEAEKYFKLSNGNYDPNLQSAMVIIDYRKGDVVGLIGGAGEKVVQRGLNRATHTYRAPGSTIKPLAVYAPGIDTEAFTAATVFDDTPVTMQVGVDTWTPSNSYKGYRGLTPVRKAIEISSNIIAAKAFQEVGASTAVSYLKKFGITSITSSDVYPGALALGGLTKGISTFEHAAAYGAIANGGVYVEPKLYTKVLDNNEEVILEKTSEIKEVLSEESAFIVTSMLRDVVVGISATGGAAALPNMPVAGKTGTTNGSMDRWFAGYTPYYVASVWTGYDVQQTVNATGNPSARLWKAVMQKVHSGLPSKQFEKPSGVVTCEVCLDSGLLATDLCRNDRRGDRTTTEYFTKDTIPTEECGTHVSIPVCPETFKLANPTCKSAVGTVNVIFIDRGYEEAPSVLPADYDYEVPLDYCEYHYCEVDEEGNYVGSNEPEKDNDYEYEDQMTPEKIEQLNKLDKDKNNGNVEKPVEQETFWWE
ncbi:MAG: penicillin-binding protein [Clostridia bacterium]|nr:penicillin-binding protein [Clostridia bacterium]